MIANWEIITMVQFSGKYMNEKEYSSRGYLDSG